MSKFDIPTPAKIRKGALANEKVRAFIAKPLVGFEHLCTEKAILEGKPVVLVYQYGYISTSAFDAEDGDTQAPQLGELLEIRPLEPLDDFHPERVVIVFDATKLPRTSLPGRGHKAKPPKASKPPKAKPPLVEASDANDELARELGLL